MATAKKKTNYIGYELEWLEKKCKQLQDWVEAKLDGGISDRIEVYESTRGNPIIKVIASEETQIKCLRDTLKELPNMLIEINRLRKIANEEETGDAGIRGDHKVPGFMDEEEQEELEVEEVKPKKGGSKKQSPKALPASTSKFNTDAYDDDFEEVDDDNPVSTPEPEELDQDGDFEDP